MAEIGRRDVVQLNQIDRKAGRVEVGGFRSAPIGGRVVKGETSADGLRQWSGALMRMFEEEAEEARKADKVDGMLRQQQGATLAQLQEEGASSATVKGFQTMETAAMLNQAYDETVQSLSGDARMLSPDEFRTTLAQTWKSLTDSIEDDDVKAFATNMGMKMLPDLAAKHITANTTWKEGKTFDAYFDVLRTMPESEGGEAFESVLDVTSPEQKAGLTQERRRQAAVNAAVQRLGDGKDDLYTFIQNTDVALSPAENSAMQKAHDRFVAESDAAFDRTLFTRVEDVNEKVRLGKMTLDQGLDAMQAMAAEYGKDDKWQGMLARRFASSEDAFREETRRKLEAAANKADKEAQFSAEVLDMVANNTFYAGSAKHKAAGFRMLDEQVAAAAFKRGQESGWSMQQTEDWMIKESAKRRVNTGVVDDALKHRFTALFSTNVLQSDGTVRDDVMQAYRMYTELRDKNPLLAYQHIGSQFARDFIDMAETLDMETSTSGEALTAAANAVQQGVRRDDFKDILSTPEAVEVTEERVREFIDQFDPGVITSMFSDTTRVGMQDVFDDEIESAVNDPAFLRVVQLRAQGVLARGAGLTADAAVQQALKDTLGSSTFIMGKMVPYYKVSIKDAMGLSNYTDPMVEHDAVMEYLREFGDDKHLWGNQWNEKGNWLEWSSTLFGMLPYPSGVRLGEKIRGVPRCDVQYNHATQMFTISPYLDDGTRTAPKVLSAAEVGRWYKAFTKQERIDRRKAGVPGLDSDPLGMGE